MKQIHIWKNHVRVTHLDLVLARDAHQPLSETLKDLKRRGIHTTGADVVVHDGVSPN
jgi:hypothetical protein